MLWRSREWRVLVLLAASVALASCGASAITRAPLERAVAGTFANLVELQLARMGLGPVPPPGIHSTATCHRVTPGRDDRGTGDWVCTITWFGPNRAVMVDAYEVAAAADGCYTATVGPGEGNLGGPRIPTPDGREARNVLYAFDGCL